VKKRIVWVPLSLLMVAALVLASCQAATVEEEGKTVEGKVTEKEATKAEEEKEEAAVTKEVTPAGPEMIRNWEGEMVEKPQYGGTRNSLVTWDYGSTADPLETGNASYVTGPVLENLGRADYSRDYDFRTYYLVVSEAVGPCLAESWEQTDPLTITFHIRQGVHWHDKAPMNGRELDAYDVEYSIHRMLGKGSGYTEPGPFVFPSLVSAVESVEATDKWTVVVKTYEYSYSTLDMLIDRVSIQPREVIEQYGGIKHWTQLVGTGPWEMTDYVEGSSWTYTKNPNYWGYDERFPGAKLRLPYIDELHLLLITDFSTQLAALRTGKIDSMGRIPIDQIESLQATNPNLLMTEAYGLPISIAFKVTEPPFDDVRVRRAMQMALDLETINKTYYQGKADTTPLGSIGKGLPDFRIPFDEWPQEYQEYHTYNPERAEQLLDEAGYPKGSDGIRFKTAYDVCRGWNQSMDLALILKDYWKKIGVDVEIKEIESGSMIDRYGGRTYTGMTYSKYRARTSEPLVDFMEVFLSDYSWNACGVNDPLYDELYHSATSEPDPQKRRQYIKDMDWRTIEMAWNLFLPVVPIYIFYQPWLKGDFARFNRGGGGDATYNWIDQNLKRELGY